MPSPTLQVLVGFQTTTGFGNPFQLDNATYGKLDTGTLGGLAFADLTSMVQAVTIDRGRNRQLDQFNAGTASITFWNESRTLDPLNSASPYYPYVLPRCPIILKADGIPIFTGVVTDWELDYDIANKDMMFARCTDQFTVLANQALNAFTPSAELSSARVNTVLDRPEILYQGPRSVATGSSTLGAYAVAQDTNVLNYLQTVATSEQGYLFMAADGTLTFKGRTSVLNQIAGATFKDDGTGIAYQTLENQFGDELLYNYVVTQSPAGAAQTTSDSTSIAAYQAQQLSILDLLNNSTTDVAALGSYLLGKFKDPVLRFTGITTELAALSATNQTICLGLEVTDVVTVTKTFTTGTPSTATQTLIVTGVNHVIRPGSHVIKYTFESADQNQYMTLDDTVFGVLDNNLLAF
jgi:hypothetical protein